MANFIEILTDSFERKHFKQYRQSLVQQRLDRLRVCWPSCNRDGLWVCVLLLSLTTRKCSIGAMIRKHRDLIISESAIYRGIYRSINQLYFQDIYGVSSLRQMFKIGLRLGKSKFSVYKLDTVTRVSDTFRRPCEVLAIKVFPMRSRSRRSSRKVLPRQFFTEVNMMTYLNSQVGTTHISKFRGAWVGKNCGFIILKMYKVTLYDVIADQPQSLAFVLKCFLILVKCVAQCHALNVAHRDIKPSNVMLSSRNNPNSVVLCDWDSSVFFTSHRACTGEDGDNDDDDEIDGDGGGETRAAYRFKGHHRQSNNGGRNNSGYTLHNKSKNRFSNTITTKNRSRSKIRQQNGHIFKHKMDRKTYDDDDKDEYTNPIGTLRYCAPEVLKGNQKYDPFKLDSWSLACVLIFMLTRKPFFEGRNEQEVLQSIYTYTNSAVKVEWCKIIENYIGKAGVDFVHSCICLDYNERMSVTQMLNHPFIKQIQ